jgi:hypothetical protein
LYDRLGIGQTVAIKMIISSLKLMIVSMEKENELAPILTKSTASPRKAVFLP